jgi:hypothetical protein
MNLIAKFVKFIYGILLYIFYARTLDLQKLLKGKRVAIIGAASSAYNTGKGSYIDSFDFVIRINKAPLILKSGKWKDDIGRRTDILFHSFFENEESGGGPLNMELYDSLGIKYVVNPIASYPGFRVSFNFYKKYLLKRVTYLISRICYKKIAQGLKNYRPTIGFCGLYSVLSCDFSELYITGFTFFKTAFGEGYRDHIRESNQAQLYIKNAGLHNPDLEFKVFLNLLKTSESKNIIMDDTLKAIVESHL